MTATEFTPTTPPKRWLDLGVCALLFAAVWLVFGQTRDFGFVDYDDPDYVSENPMITSGLTGGGMAWAFTHAHSANWHPLTTLSHMLDCQLFGLNAGAHHLTNVALHAATAVALFLLLRAMTASLGVSTAVAMLFAIHPLRVESVAWISERKDVLSGLFFCLTLLAYLRYARRAAAGVPTSDHRPLTSGFYWLALLFFACGLMSKPMLVTLPYVLLLLDFWPLARFQLNSVSEARSQLRPLVIEKIPFFILTAAACAATLLAQDTAIVPAENLALDARVANAFTAAAIYLRQIFWPVNLAVLYPYPTPGELLWQGAVSFGLVAAISVLTWRRRRDQPWLLTGWLWFLGMLVPVIGLVQVGTQAHADRYTYLPHIGIYLALALLIREAARAWRWRKEFLSAVAIALAISLGWSAHNQTRHWRDSESMWCRALSATNNNPMTRNHWGASLLRVRRVNEAIVQFQESLRLTPNNPSALNNLGMALILKGDPTNAAACFQKTLKLDPMNHRAWLHLGLIALNTENDLATAIGCLMGAVELNPKSAPTRIAFGKALVRAGRLDEAIAQCAEAVRLVPQSVEAHYELGVALAARGRLVEAEAHYAEVLRREPAHAEAQRNLGNLLLLEGKTAEAIAHYEASLKTKPDQAGTHFNLGGAFAMQQQFEKAVEHFEAALKLSPEDAAAHKNLGLALARLGRREEAIQHLNEALRLKPEFEDARRALQELKPE